jgi:hypothetical protein
MKPDNTLTITSLLAITLMSLHLTDDIVRKFEPGGLNNLIGVLILALWLYATLALAGKRSGLVILLLGSLFAAGMPVLHMSGKGVGGIAESGGGFFFIWTLFALGVTGTFALALVVQGLWHLRRRGQDVK